eukprot:comp22033_c0_seq1/m.50779 comp22033_c0_seq1/g.50779  ORF comp22033_c0_seq1/g.50779 comp22033_c0_seq1/m.50779 type:complete len:542 (-) comp22033_c0_seq1:418-2043(-)
MTDTGTTAVPDVTPLPAPCALSPVDAMKKSLLDSMLSHIPVQDGDPIASALQALKDSAPGTEREYKAFVQGNRDASNRIKVNHGDIIEPVTVRLAEAVSILESHGFHKGTRTRPQCVKSTILKHIVENYNGVFVDIVPSTSSSLKGQLEDLSRHTGKKVIEFRVDMTVCEILGKTVAAKAAALIRQISAIRTSMGSSEIVISVFCDFSIGGAMKYGDFGTGSPRVKNGLAIFEYIKHNNSRWLVRCNVKLCDCPVDADAAITAVPPNIDCAKELIAVRGTDSDFSLGFAGPVETSAHFAFVKLDGVVYVLRPAFLPLLSCIFSRYADYANFHGAKHSNSGFELALQHVADNLNVAATIDEAFLRRHCDDRTKILISSLKNPVEQQIWIDSLSGESVRQLAHLMMSPSTFAQHVIAFAAVSGVTAASMPNADRIFQQSQEVLSSKHNSKPFLDTKTQFNWPFETDTSAVPVKRTIKTHILVRVAQCFIPCIPGLARLDASQVATSRRYGRSSAQPSTRSFVMLARARAIRRISSFCKAMTVH